MAKAYSIDLRKKVIESYENNEGSIRKLAKRFKASKGFIFSILKKLKETGTIYPKPRGKGRNSSIKPEGKIFVWSLTPAFVPTPGKSFLEPSHRVK